MTVLKMPRRYRITEDHYGFNVAVWTGARFVQVKFCYSRKMAEDYVINQRHAGDVYEPARRSFYD